MIFIDDINMPLTEKYGAQPPIEFLRLLLDANIAYDRPQFFKKRIESFKVNLILREIGKFHRYLLLFE